MISLSLSLCASLTGSLAHSASHLSGKPRNKFEDTSLSPAASVCPYLCENTKRGNEVMRLQVEQITPALHLGSRRTRSRAGAELSQDSYSLKLPDDDLHRVIRALFTLSGGQEALSFQNKSKGTVSWDCHPLTSKNKCEAEDEADSLISLT